MANNEAVSFELKETQECTNCGSTSLLEDNCASEDMLVCQDCGSVMMAGSLDGRRDYCEPSTSGPPPLLQQYNTEEESRKKAKLGIHVPYIERKKSCITTAIYSMCDKLRIHKRDKNICIAKLSDIIRNNDIPKWASNNEIAALVIFLFATDHSPTSMKKIQGLLKVKMKKFRTMLKKLQEIQSFQCTKPVRKSVQEIFADELDDLELFRDDITLRKQCLSMSCSIWELLHVSYISKCINFRDYEFILAIILLTMENIYKTKTRKQLYQDVVKSDSSESNRLQRYSGFIRKALFLLVKDLPGLECFKGKREFCPMRIARYLTTIVQNKSYLIAQKKITDHQEAQRNLEEMEEDQPLETQSQTDNPFLCIPMEFNWPDNESSLSDVDDDDIDQYLASENEIADKKKLYDNDEIAS